MALKLIAEGIDLYDIDAITSEAAGFEMEFMQDRKLSTSWKATSTALQNIDCDLNGVIGSARYFFFYHNISHNSETTTIKIYSDDNDGFSSPTQRGSTETLTAATTPYVMIDLGAAFAERYWRITIENSDIAPQIYLVFFGNRAAATFGITTRYMFGQLEEPIYKGSKIIETPGGMRYARQYHDGRDRFEYAWDHLDATNETRLQDVIALTKGSALPFFIQDIDSAYHYVRLMNSGIGARQVAHTLFNTGRLIFEEEF